ncbi:hypothetical protein DYQ86_15705 [Acidobacteria bacterium AB60]|nr:hypothetical protein DYQ86_15705 [Acidobacteria bacterium AB60]
MDSTERIVMVPKKRSVVASTKPADAVSPPLPNFDAEVDVKTQAGAFAFSLTKLYLQLQPIPTVTTPSGLHAESKIYVDLSVPAAQQRVALYFDATTQNGLDIDFTLSLTRIDDHFQPAGPKKVYELKWKTSPQAPAFLDGPVYLKDLKGPDDGGGKDK